MEKIISIIVLASLFIFCINTSSSSANNQKKKNPPLGKSGQSSEEDAEVPLSFKNVIGNWRLKYSGNYGYYFSLSPNYHALVIIYLNTQALIFRGVYTINDENKLRINISEMKDEPRVTALNLYKGFMKAKSSYFLFAGYRVKKNNRAALNLQPRAIVIDGNNSDGYFEPSIKLAKEP